MADSVSPHYVPTEREVICEVKSAEGNYLLDRLRYEQVFKAAPKLLQQLFTFEDDQPCIKFRHGESNAAIAALSRYVRSGDYLPSDTLPSSLLLHLQVLKMGERFDIHELQLQANSNIFQVLEYSCCISKAVIDLSDGIRFLYLEFSDEESMNVKQTIAHYCVSNFIYHNLGHLEEFRQTVYEAPDFHRTLIEANFAQAFTSEGASEIMTMELCPHRAHRAKGKDIVRSSRFLCRFHTSGLEPTASIEQIDTWREPTEADSFVLVERPRQSFNYFDKPRPLSEMPMQTQDYTSQQSSSDSDSDWSLLDASQYNGDSVPGRDATQVGLLLNSASYSSPTNTSVSETDAVRGWEAL